MNPDVWRSAMLLVIGFGLGQGLWAGMALWRDGWELRWEDGVSRDLDNQTHIHRVLARMERLGFLWRVSGTCCPRPRVFLIKKRAEEEYAIRSTVALEQWYKDYPEVDKGTTDA